MVVSAVIGFFIDAPERIALGVGLLGMLLYHRKVTRLGSVFSSVTARVAFGLAMIGALLLLGIIPGLRIDTALGYVEQLVALGGDLLARLREVVGA